MLAHTIEADNKTALIGVMNLATIKLLARNLDDDSKIGR